MTPVLLRVCCRLKNRVFSSSDLRGLDFSEQKADGAEIQKTLEVCAWPAATARLLGTGSCGLIRRCRFPRRSWRRIRRPAGCRPRPAEASCESRAHRTPAVIRTIPYVDELCQQDTDGLVTAF